MSLLKRLNLVLFALIILSGTVYYLGCSSAESTTGKLAFQQKDYIKAEEELKKGLAVDVNDDEGWYMLGYSQVELGKLKEAQQSFKKSLSISNLYGDKILALWVDKYNRGAKAFQNGIDAEANKDMSTAKGYFQDALLDFQTSAAIIPDSLKSLSAVGQTYLALGEKENAISILNEIAAKSTNPEDAVLAAKVLFETGLALMQQNTIEPAIGTFRKVLTIPNLPKDNPYFETSTYNLALALAKTGENMRIADENSDYKGQYTEALNLLKPMTTNLTKKDLEPQIWELLVTVYANLDMTDEAKDALEKKNSLQK